MNNSFLLKQCKLIYQAMQQEMQGCQFQQFDEAKWIEKGFCITMKAWLNIEKITAGCRFMNQQEEVYFYKTLKPRFTGLIDYFKLSYKSVLFQPDDSTKIEAYWRSELKNCNKLMAGIKTACRRFEQQHPDTDIYFLRQNNQQPLNLVIDVNNFKLTSIPYVYLPGLQIAVKKYKKFLQEKINTSMLERCLIAA